jgi:hypothetical protein
MYTLFEPKSQWYIYGISLPFSNSEVYILYSTLFEKLWKSQELFICDLGSQ